MEKSNHYIHWETHFKSVVSGTTTAPQKTADEQYAIHTDLNTKEINLALSNRANLEKELSGALLTLRQTHSDIIHVIEPDNLIYYMENPLIEGDGFLTTINNVILGILTADCAPVMIYNDDVIGIVHAGWKGTKAQIHIRLLEMLSEFSPNKNFHVIIAPHIMSCCYQVGDEFKDYFPENAFTRKKDGLYFDLSGVIKEDLIKSGLSENDIFDSAYCTRCHQNPSFFSYRAGDTDYRSLSFIVKRSK